MATTAEQLASLTATFEAFARQHEKQAIKADTDRSHMMDAITNQGKALDRLAMDMAEVKPITTMVSGIRAKAAGAFMLAGFVGAIAWMGVQFFREAIMHWLGGAP